MKRLPWMMATLATVLAATTLGCQTSLTDEGSTGDDATEQALVNCTDQPMVALQVKAPTTGAGAPLAFYSDPHLSAPSGQLASGSVVVLDLTDPNALLTDSIGTSKSALRVHRADDATQTGYVDASALAIRAPQSGSCADGKDPARFASPNVRSTSLPQPLSTSSVSSTFQCAVNMGKGFVQGGTSLVTGIATLAGWTEDAVMAAAATDRDLLLASFGQDDARKRLNDASANARDKARAALALIGHAIPTLHAYLQEQYDYYQAQPPAVQNQILCGIVGRVGFDVALALTPAALAKVGTLGRSEELVAAVERAHVAAAKDAPLAGASRSYVIRPGPASVERQGALSGSDPTAVTYDLKMSDVQAKAAKFDKAYSGIKGAYFTTIKLQQIQAMNDLVNPAMELGLTGEGNCGFAALALAASIRDGVWQSAWFYVRDTDWMAVQTQAFADLGATGTGEKFASSALMAEADVLGEGQIGALISEGTKGAHSTLVARVDGKLIHINNQNWPNKMGPLQEWPAFWEQYFGDSQYIFYPLDVYLPK